MQDFPYDDSYWVSAADFVEAHRQPEELLIAPLRFSQRLGQVQPYTQKLTSMSGFHWAIVHKGSLDKLRPELMRSIAAEAMPVFANEVFVVFSNRTDLAQLEASTPHLAAFHEQTNPQQAQPPQPSESKALNLKLLGFDLSLKRHRQESHPESIEAVDSVSSDELLQSPPLEPPIPPEIARLDQMLEKLQHLEGYIETLHQKIDRLSTQVEQQQNQLDNQLKLLPPRNYSYMGGYQALAETVWGHKIYLDTRDRSLAPHLLLKGYWEDWIAKVFAEQIQDGMTVIDVGANVGYYTLLAASRVGAKGKVYSFEANPAVYSNLFQSVEINGFLDRTVLLNKAVYSHSAKLKFNRLKYHHGGSTLMNVHAEFNGELMDEFEVIEVEAVSLDDYFSNGIPKVDLVKIDAEGSEASIFKGMQDLIAGNPQLKILFEFNPNFILGDNQDPNEFLQELENSGFQIYRIEVDSTLSATSSAELIQSSSHAELLISKSA